MLSQLKYKFKQLRRKARALFYLRKCYRHKSGKGFSSYTVITPVYNCAPYLDHYFRHITGQVLDFKNNISIVIVDRGSTDGSWEIVQKWKKRFPHNISDLRIPGASENDAVNNGIESAAGEWFTTINAHDFIDYMYFFNLDKTLKKQALQANSNLSILSPCIALYYNKYGTMTFDRHKTAGRKLWERQLRGDIIQGIPYFIVNRSKFISICTKIYPPSNVGKDYLYTIAAMAYEYPDSSIKHAYSSIYFKRIYEEPDSQTCAIKNSPCAFPQKIYLPVLEYHHDISGCIPDFIQKATTHATINTIKSLQQKNGYAVLPDSALEKYIHVYRNIFKYIDESIILSYQEGSHASNAYKYWILSLFKPANPQNRIISIFGYDNIKSLLTIGYTALPDDTEEVAIDDQTIRPSNMENIKYAPATGIELIIRYIKVSIPQNSSVLQLKINGQPARIIHGNTIYKDAIKVARFNAPNSLKATVLADTWVFCDLADTADDNARHFYEYVKKHHPEQDIIFALSKNSPDWKRLGQAGFKLIDYNSTRCNTFISKANKIICSHLPPKILAPLENNELRGEIVYLGHGIKKDNINKRLGPYKIDYLVTAIKGERDYLMATGNHYSWRNIIAPGFPRHDSLLEFTRPQKYIFIMPTWRTWLIDHSQRATRKKTISKMNDSLYLNVWTEFLNSDRLKALTQQHGYTVIFHPHHTMKDYINCFKLPDYIATAQDDNMSIQQLLGASAIIITDYSSIAFDMAFMERSVIYYQFDREEFFLKQHHPGYFDYHRDGFGPVCPCEDDLHRELEKMLANNAAPEPAYLDRMRKAFPNKDGKNCERLYKYITQ